VPKASILRWLPTSETLLEWVIVDNHDHMGLLFHSAYLLGAIVCEMIGAGDKALEYLEHVIIPIAPDGAGSYARPSSDTVTGWVATAATSCHSCHQLPQLPPAGGEEEASDSTTNITTVGDLGGRSEAEVAMAGALVAAGLLLGVCMLGERRLSPGLKASALPRAGDCLVAASS
jgi:hypothetical protein